MRLIFTIVLLFALMLSACGGGDDDADDTDDSPDSPTATANSGGSDTDSTAAAEDSADDESEPASPTARQTQGSAEPTRTPRPTSTPFPTATPITLPPTATPGTEEPDAEKTAETPAGEATVEIISTNVFRNPEAGSAIIFGEVQNIGDTQATGVEVRAELFNANGDRVGRGESEAVGKTVMQPGDIAGFSIIVTFVDGEYVEWSSESIVADYNVVGSGSSGTYTDQLTLTDDTLVAPETGFDFVDVTGNLTNASGSTLTFIQVGAIAYDASGNVISVDSFATTEPLAPGASIPFAVEFSRGRLKDFPASYALVVEGLVGE